MRPREVLAVICPSCGTGIGEWCPGLEPKSHQERFLAARGDRCDKVVYRRKNYAAMIARQQSAKSGQTIVAYRCARCHGHHTGHPTDPVTRERVQ